MEGPFCKLSKAEKGFYRQRDHFVNYQAKRAIMGRGAALFCLEIPRRLLNFANFDLGPFCFKRLDETDVILEFRQFSCLSYQGRENLFRILKYAINFGLHILGGYLNCANQISVSF